MSYCWRLQYYCKLGAAHGAEPIYYVSRLPQQAHQFRNQLKVLVLPRVSTGGHAGWLQHHTVPQAKELYRWEREHKVCHCARRLRVSGLMAGVSRLETALPV